MHVIPVPGLSDWHCRLENLEAAVLQGLWKERGQESTSYKPAALRPLRGEYSGVHRGLPLSCDIHWQIGACAAGRRISCTS